MGSPLRHMTDKLRKRLLLAMVCVLPLGAQALDVQRTHRPLAQQQTVLAPARDAPSSTLAPNTVSGRLTSGGPATSLQSANGPQTLLRAAEIPPERIERTKVLTMELKAQPTPKQEITIDLPADVLFDFDKADLRTDAMPSLEKAAELTKSYPDAPLTVRGHTDAKGSDSYNDALSLRRADGVARVLKNRTGRTPRAEGLGKREPIAANTTPDGQDNPQGRQQNRRVQILIGLPSTNR